MTSLATQDFSIFAVSVLIEKKVDFFFPQPKGILLTDSFLGSNALKKSLQSCMLLSWQ